LIMVIYTVKITYVFDVETVRTLEDLARRWNVSKSEALRRAIRASSAQTPPRRALTPIRPSTGCSDRWASRLEFRPLGGRAPGRLERFRKHEVRGR
jgi:hypothetical protein